MNWQYTPYVLVLTIAAGVAILLAIYAWPRRAAPGGIYFVFLKYHRDNTAAVKSGLKSRQSRL